MLPSLSDLCQICDVINEQLPLELYNKTSQNVTFPEKALSLYSHSVREGVNVRAFKVKLPNWASEIHKKLKNMKICVQSQGNVVLE